MEFYPQLSSDIMSICTYYIELDIGDQTRSMFTFQYYRRIYLVHKCMKKNEIVKDQDELKTSKPLKKLLKGMK